MNTTEQINALFEKLNVNKDKKTIELYRNSIGKRVSVWGNRYEDVKRDALGTYIAKHVEIAMHYILLDGEEIPRPFHTFEIEFIY